MLQGLLMESSLLVDDFKQLLILGLKLLVGYASAGWLLQRQDCVFEYIPWKSWRAEQ